MNSQPYSFVVDLMRHPVTQENLLKKMLISHPIGRYPDRLHGGDLCLSTFEFGESLLPAIEYSSERTDSSHLVRFARFAYLLQKEGGEKSLASTLQSCIEQIPLTCRRLLMFSLPRNTFLNNLA